MSDPTPTRSAAEPAPRVGLVLGGGGAIGAAYHAGALAAIENDLGWDPRTADVIVGTSAGSIVGALLRRDVAASDLAALSVGAELHDVRPRVVESLERRPAFPPMTLANLVRVPRIPPPSTVYGLARMAASRRRLPFGALSVLLPEGRQTLQSHLTFLDEIVGTGWPNERLLIAAVRRRDLHRTIFGSRPTRPTLAAAVAASCAVPGYFADVEVNGEAYIDGGVISATNADVLAHQDVDLAIVVSPMTGQVRRRSTSDVMRGICRRDLNRELRILDRKGIPSVVIEPGADVLRHMSNDFMSEDLTTEIVRDALLDTGAQIAGSPLLRGLNARRSAERDAPPLESAAG
jgi:NTE family protein